MICWRAEPERMESAVDFDRPSCIRGYISHWPVMYDTRFLDAWERFGIERIIIVRVMNNGRKEAPVFRWSGSQPLEVRAGLLFTPNPRRPSFMYFSYLKALYTT